MTGKRLEIPIKRILLGAKPADVVIPERRRQARPALRIRGVRPGVSVEAGDPSASGFPRIVRLLPTRSRDPKTARTTENTAAGLLLAATIFAILWANSPWAESYWTLLNTPVGFSFGDMRFDMTVKHLINDGLMTFFFFIVGLEVMAEFTIGELTDRARAAVPVLAAIAGLAVPALIFLLINPTGDNAQAWGVVISTDTAFLIGALAIIKPKFPARLRIFLLTLAVVDDIGALTVIALFYSHGIRIVPLLVAAAFIVAIALVRYLPVGRGPAYAAFGFGLWVALFIGGVHPTLAGVAIALLIPVFTPERRQVEQAVELIRAFRQSPNSEYARAASRGLRESISRSTSGCRPSSAPTCRSWFCLCSRWSTPG